MLDLVRDLGAVFDAGLYRRVLARQRSAMALLLSLLVLVSATQAIAAWVSVQSFVGQPGLQDVAAKLPHLTIQDGVLTVDAVQPFVLPSVSGKGGLAIFDTTGRTTDFGERSGPGALFLRDAVRVRLPDGSVRVAPYPPGLSVELGPVVARDWAVWASHWLAPCVAVSVLVLRTLGALLYRLGEAAILATVTLPARWIIGSKVGWVDRARLALVASLVSIAVDGVLVFAARAFQSSPGTWISLVLLDLAILGWALSVTAVDPSNDGEVA